MLSTKPASFWQLLLAPKYDILAPKINQIQLQLLQLINFSSQILIYSLHAEILLFPNLSTNLGQMIKFRRTSLLAP
jgi:hypothetical protein